MQGTTGINGWIRRNASNLISYAGLAFCIVLFSILSSGRLWSAYNISVLIEAVGVYTILSIGAVFIYSMGYMDISIGAQLGVSTILLIKIVNLTGSLLAGFLVALVITMACGALNGAVAAWLGLPSIVTSMFISFVFTGLQALLMEQVGSNSIVINYDLSGWVTPLALGGAMVAIALLAGYIFNFTRLGKYTRAIGANETATMLVGINTTKWKLLAYMFFGFCIAVAAVFLVARTGTAGKGTGNGYAMDVMVALILGGMYLSGGMKSRISSAIVGTFTYVILSNGLTLSGVSFDNINVIKAIIFIVVILLTCRKKNGMLPR